MSYYTTRGKNHLINPGNPEKTYCGKKVEDVNKATNSKTACNCSRCKNGQSKRK